MRNDDYIGEKIEENVQQMHNFGLAVFLATSVCIIFPVVCVYIINVTFTQVSEQWDLSENGHWDAILSEGNSNLRKIYIFFEAFWPIQEQTLAILTNCAIQITKYELIFQNGSLANVFIATM